METYFAFDTKISYSCKECGGLCCNLNAQLQFTLEQMSDYRLIPFRDYFVKKGNTYFCKTPKKCWFLKENRCVLEKNKPFCCKLYPLRIYRLQEDYAIIEFIPCPKILFGSDKEKEYNLIVSEYIKKNFVEYHPNLKKLENFTFTVEKLHTLAALLDKTFEKCPNINFLDYFIKQIFFDPIIFNILNEKNVSELMTSYFTFKAHLIKSANDNLQNLYIMILNDFTKYVLFKYYSPTKYEQPNFDFHIKTISDFYDFKEYAVFNKYYNSELKWIPN